METVKQQAGLKATRRSLLDQTVLVKPLILLQHSEG